VACATAGIIVGIVGMGFGSRITAIVEVASGGSVFLLLLLTAVASLVLGMGLPTTATYIVMASLVANVIVQLGAKAGLEVSPIAAHLFCFFFGILADDTPPVGLAAYAGAAIAGSNPFRTGVQGFLYDLRTAILPFMFVLNADLLLIGVHGWWHVAIVFVATTIALFSFASLTQNYLRARNRVHESGLLLLSTALLLRPRLVGNWMRSLSLGEPVETILASKFLWYAVGAALFFAVWWLQRSRTRADQVA